MNTLMVWAYKKPGCRYWCITWVLPCSSVEGFVNLPLYVVMN